MCEIEKLQLSSKENIEIETFANIKNALSWKDKWGMCFTCWKFNSLSTSYRVLQKSYISFHIYELCNWLVWCLYRSMKTFPPLLLVFYDYCLYNPMLIRVTSAGSGCGSWWRACIIKIWVFRIKSVDCSCYL